MGQESPIRKRTCMCYCPFCLGDGGAHWEARTAHVRIPGLIYVVVMALLATEEGRRAVGMGLQVLVISSQPPTRAWPPVPPKFSSFSSPSVTHPPPLHRASTSTQVGHTPLKGINWTHRAKGPGGRCFEKRSEGALTAGRGSGMRVGTHASALTYRVASSRRRASWFVVARYFPAGVLLGNSR